jgi:phosphoribosylformylglycinamidine synthase
MKFGVVTFPGSNSDFDSYSAAKLLGEEVEFIWHQSEDLAGSDVVVLPGGFAHGDYLRSGAIARFSPIMKSVTRFAKSGGFVIGFCNGFQVLVESGLLPGALMRNDHLRFSGKFIHIRVEKNDNPFTVNCRPHDVLRVPIAHKDGNYYNFDGDIAKLEKNGQVLFRYCDKDGNLNKENNPNGSINNIAGITNVEGNIVGMMPHPERAVEDIIGSADGFKIFTSIKKSYLSRVKLERA